MGLFADCTIINATKGEPIHRNFQCMPLLLILFLFEVMKLMDCLNPLKKNYFNVNEYRVSKHCTRLSISNMFQLYLRNG
jgi:hypothetical protein